jgi:DNA polymerase-3 subunit epsilon
LRKRKLNNYLYVIYLTSVLHKMSKKLLFLDLETSGLPERIGFSKYYDPSDLAKYASSRIVQLAIDVYEVTDTERKLIKSHDYIVKPEGFVILNHEIHGIDHTLAEFTGLPWVEIVDKISDDLKTGDLLVAHNLAFDKNILLSELHRAGRDTEIAYVKALPEFCTSYNMRDIMKLHYNEHEYKWPNLSELYLWLFPNSELPKNMHNAATDVDMLAKCFSSMVFEKKLFTLG